MTEWISGVNIPSCQLMVGMGVPLSRIPDIRRLYGQDPKGTSQINFDSDPQIPPSGAQQCLADTASCLLCCRHTCSAPVLHAH